MINNISLNNFRQFDNLKLNTNNSLVIISGKNARGKTSILESIFIASTTKSHRENNLENVIKFNEPFSKIEINAEKKYKVVISKENKNLFINGNEIKKSSDYLGNIDVVMIAPTDISLIRGSKGDKRRFLDLNISILNKKYLNESSKYKKTLNERNVLLKSKNIDNLMLDVLTNQLVESIKYIYDSRIYLIDKLNYYLKDISKDMKIESIKLLYEPSYNPDNVLDSLVMFLYSKPSTRKKKVLWYVCGDMLYARISSKLSDKGYCTKCGRRSEKLINGWCEPCTLSDGVKPVRCKTCGKEFYVPVTNNKTNYCNDCKIEYNKEKGTAEYLNVLMHGDGGYYEGGDENSEYIEYNNYYIN